MAFDLPNAEDDRSRRVGRRTVPGSRDFRLVRDLGREDEIEREVDNP
jgi:hypothetical protein